jgi:hypothetical protein
MQLSLVQGFPSLQSSGEAIHIPVAGSHPSSVQSLKSLQTVGVLMHEPSAGLHESMVHLSLS